jgi:Kef-type K+ transport system membrane component KefB
MYLAGAAVNIYYVAATWLGMALLASVVSIRIAVPAALVEIVVGALAGNIPGIREHVTPDRRRGVPGQRRLPRADVPGRS